MAFFLSRRLDYTGIKEPLAFSQSCAASVQSAPPSRAVLCRQRLEGRTDISGGASPAGPQPQALQGRVWPAAGRHGRGAAGL